MDEILTVLRQRYGAEWGADDSANLRFAVDAETMLRAVDGAHLIGDAEIEAGRVRLTFWVDEPIDDLLSADQLAFDIFSRISEEVFYVERRFEPKSIRYPFVTGSPTHGHVGDLILAGPHVADYAERQMTRGIGGTFYQA